MDVLEQFIRSISYKFPKGYPDMKNEQDILMLENEIKKMGIPFSFSILTEEILIFEATDREISSNTKKAIPYFLDNVDASYGFKIQSDANRLGNPNKVAPDQIQSLFKDTLGADDITIHGPKTGPNPSGKFDMYEFESDKFGPVRIILSGGGNAGEKYEQDFVAKAKAFAGKPNSELPNDLKELYSKLNIDNTKLTAKDIEFAGSKDTKRSLDLTGPQPIGSTISDLDIEYNGKMYYISLKNKAGSGLYSGPNVSFIVYDGENVVYDSSKKGVSPSIDLLFDMFNIDPQRLADGLNNYVKQEGQPDNWTNTKIDNDKFIKLLASSIGYGYYYVRETKPGEVKVVPILSPQDAYDAIGKITNVEIKYPGPTTKILALKIDTDSPTFGPSQYLVAVRNTQGKLLPLSLRISKTK
jgi:hypothetical protein